MLSAPLTPPLTLQTFTDIIITQNYYFVNRHKTIVLNLLIIKIYHKIL